MIWGPGHPTLLPDLELASALGSERHLCRLIWPGGMLSEVKVEHTLPRIGASDWSAKSKRRLSYLI